MITEQPFLPLFFNTEDEDLWEKLKKFPIEKRAELTKHALRELFRGYPELLIAPSCDDRVEAIEGAELSIIAEVDDDGDGVTGRTAGLEGIGESDEGNDVCEDEEHGDDFEEPPGQLEFSLESLFEMSPAEVKPNPVQNLLSIIGKEEDEEVLRLFRRSEEHKEE